jgi:arylsulfatase A-like enzyme
MATPNLLFLYTDEQAFNTLAAYGNRRIDMPNLDRLAEQSVVFDQAYVTQPVCTPSRSSLLTGLYPHTTGCTENNVPLPPDLPCLPEMLPEGDYVTGHFGKWHLGDEIFAQHGFDEWVSIEDAYSKYYRDDRDRSARSSYHHFLVDNGFIPDNGEIFGRSQAARLPEEYGKPAFLAREASRFIREHRGSPFVLYVNFLEPHMPFFGPRDGQYEPSDMPLPANFETVPTAEQPLKTRLLRQYYQRNGHSGLPLRTAADWQRMIANYWGLCSLVDTHAGAIFDTLDECGLRDNTIVVFTSDHGDMMGAHRLLAKCTVFQEAVRVPLLLRLPGQTRGKRVTGPVSQIDVVPTLLDLLGQPVSDRLQGRSLRVMMNSENPTSDQDVFIEWNGPNSGLGADVVGQVQLPEWAAELADVDEVRAAVRDPVRTVVTPDGWKLNCSPQGEHELYNLRDDPFETRNLHGRKEYSQIIDSLAERIRRWQDRTNDAVQLPEM